MTRLGQLLEQASSIPAQGVVTHFCDPDELGEYWDALARKRIVAGLCGGSPFPRKAMLKLMPPGKANAVTQEVGVREAMANWREEGRKFPLKWLRVFRGGGDITPITKQDADRIFVQLADAGLSLQAVGDILRKGDEIFLLADTRLEDETLKALRACGMDADAALRFDPESCAQEVGLNVSLPRLDAVVARAFHIGREEAKKAVTKGFVAVNLRICRDAGREVVAGDVIQHLLAGAALIGSVREAKSADRHRLLGIIPSSAKILVRG
jgi:ribosomal 50S subunit-recycling heat shock protein